MPRGAFDLEEQELLLLTRTELETALDRGEIKILAWTTAVAFALQHLKKSTRYAEKAKDLQLPQYKGGR